MPKYILNPETLLYEARDEPRYVKTLRIEGRLWNLDEGETPYGDISKMDILDGETLTIEEKSVTIRLRDVLPKEGEA